MPKRFTDSEKWRDPWFDNLTPIDKLFWLYILDNCDHAGVWKANWKQVVSSIGGEPNMGQFLGRIERISEEKVFIPKFLVYQYGTKWENSKASASGSAVKILSDIGMLEKARELLSNSKKSRPIQRQPLPNPYPTLTLGLGKSNGNGNDNNQGNGYNNGNDNGREKAEGGVWE